METERQLLDAIKGGDRQAMRRLYDRYAKYAMAIAIRYISDRESTKDIVQDSFVSILTAIDRFDYRGEGSLKSWVRQIVSHSAIDWLKEHQQLRQLTDTLDETETETELPDVEGIPPDILNQMISQLPTGYRVVLNLHVFEQLSHKAIAQRLGIKEGTSASQFSRAKVLLADMIKKYLNSQRI